MKKTLIALTVAALASTSASALTVFNDEGMQVDVFGKIKAQLEASETGDVTHRTGINKKDARIGVKMQYAINDSAYVLGVYEHDFADAATLKAYAGLGGYGHQVTIGLQNSFSDYVGQATFDNAFGVGAEFIPDDADNMISYRYTGLANWTFGADYVFESESDDLNGNNHGNSDNWASIGAQYSADGFTAGFAYAAGDESHAIDTGFSYQMNDVIYALDFGFKDDSKTDYDLFYVTPGVKVMFGDAAVYGSYTFYKADGKKGLADTNAHGINLGTEYNITKNALVYLEGNYWHAESGDSDKAIGLGMKVEW